MTGMPVPSGICTCHACTCPGCHRCDGSDPQDRISAATLREWARRRAETRYCDACGASEDCHAPGGSRYGTCTYEPPPS